MKQPSLAWRLDDLYKGMDDPKIEADFKHSDDLITDLMGYRGKIASLTPLEMLILIKTWEDLAFSFHKIGLFAGSLETTNVNVPEVTRFVKKIEESIVLKNQNIIFLEVELARLPNKKWDELLAANELALYHHFLAELREQAKHILTEPEEKILSEKSQTSWQALSHLFQITTDTLTFKWDRKSITLEELLTKFYDPDATVRERAAKLIHSGLKTNDKTTPAIYNALVQDKSISDRLRHFDFPEQARFEGDEVDKPMVEAMVTAVTEAYPLVERYYSLKKTILNTPKLYWWDRYAPLPELKTTIDIDTAKSMVQEAYHAFSPELGNIVAEMYKQEHIDWLPSPHKQGGAYCSFGGRDIYPYVLLNYTNSPRDVMTVAHELGHAVHDVLAQKNNVFLQTHPSLALAEIASIFGEFLLFEKLIHGDLPKEDRISLIMSFIENAFSTTFRQTTMFQFEQAIHTKRKEEGELSKDEIDSLWQEIMSKPFASSLEYTDEHQNTWMYVPHIIRSPFYVYSYSFAKLCVLSLIAEYKIKGNGFVATYLQLLRAGGALSPKDNLKLAGHDISQNDFWHKGFTVIETYIDELEKEIKA